MTITGGSALSKEDIDRMVKDAEQYAEEDRKAKETVEVRNQADTLVHSTEKFVAENEDKISDEVKTEVKADVDALKESLQGEDIEAIKQSMTKLGESSQKMGAAMYAEQGAPGAEGAGAADGGASSESAEEDVVDAEIVDDDSDEGENK